MEPDGALRLLALVFKMSEKEGAYLKICVRSLVVGNLLARAVTRPDTSTHRS
jgi:hypothetical protein